LQDLDSQYPYAHQGRDQIGLSQCRDVQHADVLKSHDLQQRVDLKRPDSPRADHHRRPDLQRHDVQHPEPAGTDKQHPELHPGELQRREFEGPGIAQHPRDLQPPGELDDCSDHDLVAGIGRLHLMTSGLQAELLSFIAEYDRRRLWERDGCRHMGQWLAGHLGVTVSEGMRWTTAAHALEQLPRIAAGLRSGVLSFDKILQLARFATPETEKGALGVGPARQRECHQAQGRPRHPPVTGADPGRPTRDATCGGRGGTTTPP
jgi:Domain of unknown function (DUF222)